MDSENSLGTTPAQVYLLHFEQPYWNKAQHYVGYTTIGASERIEKHRNGKGSLLVNYAHNKKGIPFQVTMVIDFEDDGEYTAKQLARHFEKKLKHEGHLSRHCPICKERRKANG